IRLMVRATPKSARDCVDGLIETPQGRALAVKVRAVADKGEANRAVAITVAEWLGVAKSSVALAAGGKSRIKTLLVAGERDKLAQLLQARLARLG
ncbi:MAG TPA: DUF167 family protein, partial [Hyphomicrobiaceae bacterium]|nr:DUF167 family protein [Hyphomicrobiaceae bacterium]